MKTLLAALTVALTLLTGCSSVRLVDSEVLAVSTLAAGSAALAGARYRFERLPSQAAQPQLARMESLAEAALARVGLVRDDAQAQYSVLLEVRVYSFLADDWGNPITSPWGPGAWPGHGQLVIGSGGAMVGFGVHYPPSTAYSREISLLLRDLRSSQVVYETRAVNSSPWYDTDNVLAAMLQAALKDFPNPPAGTRRVNIEIPR